MENTPASQKLLYNELSWKIIGSAIEVHRALGPGLLESTYSACFAHELACRGLPFDCQRPIAVRYKDLVVEHAFRADFVVGDSIIVELKAVEELNRDHTAQTRNYLRLSGIRVGLIFNFGARNLRQGMRRLVV